MASCAVLGATGAVGRFVVKTLVNDARVDRVTAIVRSERPASFFFLGDGEGGDKLTQLVVPDVSQLGKHAAALAGTTHGFCCLGVYTSKAGSEAEFRAVELELNVGAARLFKEAGATSCTYLSGQGAKSSGWAMFARVKGDTETAIRELGFEQMAAMRPPYIADRPGAAAYPGERFVNSHMRWVLCTRFAVRAEDVAWAMARFSLSGGGGPGVFEAADIKREAALYGQEQGLEASRAPPSPSS